MTSVAAAVLFVAAATAVAVPSAVAHAGGDCGLDAYRLEGECYTRGDYGCDPDFNGEHTRIEPDTGSGGASGEVPNNGCGLNYENVRFDEWVRPDDFAARSAGNGNVHTHVLVLYVDGVETGRGEFTTRGGEPHGVFEFSTATAIAPGSHDLRVEYERVNAASYVGVALDYIDFRASDPADPEPEPDSACEGAFSPGICAPVDNGEGIALQTVDILSRTAADFADYAVNSTEVLAQAFLTALDAALEYLEDRLDPALDDTRPVCDAVFATGTCDLVYGP